MTKYRNYFIILRFFQNSKNISFFRKSRKIYKANYITAFYDNMIDLCKFYIE